MTHSNAYIEKVVSELTAQSPEERHSHYQHLDWILEQIAGLPSPEKESLFLDLITSRGANPTQEYPLHSSP